MKKTIVFFLAIAMQLNALTMNVAANSVVSYDKDTSIVNIRGSIEEKNKRITVEILKPGVTSNDLKNVSAEQMSQYIYTARQIVTDADGVFGMEFKMEEATADYIVRIKSDKIEEITLKYVNSEEYKTALNKINAPDATAKQILEVIEEFYTSLGMSQKYFSQLLPEDKLAVAEEVLAYRNNLVTDKFEDYKELDKAYNTAVVIKSINSLKENGIDGTDILDEYADIFGLKETKVWSIYEQLEPSEKKDIAAKMSSGEDIETAQDLKNSFVEYTVLNKIQNADTYTIIYDLINENSDVLNVNLAAYNQLSEINKALVMQKIVGQSYTSASQLSQAIATSIAGFTQYSVAGGGGGGSTGGGSGSKNTSSAITIAVAEPAVKQTENEPFSDIGSYAWAKESIISLYSKGIVSGRDDGKFYPADAVRREEFVKMLVSGLGLNQKDINIGFIDVEENMWYAPYIFAASEAGLVKGIEDNVFGVGRNVTRQDIAVFLYRAAGFLNVELPKITTPVFDDKESISAYALDAVNALSKAGIINGNENGEFAPQKSATRAETARLIAEFLKFTD